MSKTFADLVNDFNKLSSEERTKFRDLVVHSNPDAELYGDITDEDVDTMGMESFARLEEENAAKARRGVEG